MLKITSFKCLSSWLMRPLQRAGTLRSLRPLAMLLMALMIFTFNLLTRMLSIEHSFFLFLLQRSIKKRVYASLTINFNLKFFHDETLFYYYICYYIILPSILVLKLQSPIFFSILFFPQNFKVCIWSLSLCILQIKSNLIDNNKC